MSSIHEEAGATAAARRAMPLDQLIEAVVAAAPECVKQGQLLQSVDWARVPPASVRAMLSALEAERVRVPQWLARGLLIGGHTLPPALNGQLPPDLRVLNQLDSEAAAAERNAIGSALRGLPGAAHPDADVVAAILRRLVQLGWREEATALGLASWGLPQRALKPVGPQLAAHRQGLPAARLRIAGFSSTHMLAQDIASAFAAAGWSAQVDEASFGEALGELMNPAAPAEAFLLLMDIDGFVARDWRRAPAESLALIGERADLLGSALTSYAQRGECPLLINTIPAGAAPTAGLIDRRHALGLRRAIDLINERIIESAERSGAVIVVDADAALADIAASAQTDAKLWFYGRFAYSAAATRALAEGFAQAWRLLKRGPAKVLAVDFDNTLWGGVYGDDGLEALACGWDFPGNAFRALQEECLRLKSQGMLLVGLSKNNADAISVFERHPGMALKANDFAATAINWDPKPENVRKMAADLNLGLDSFLFLDDSPHEREAMRQMCPAVAVPEMPADPATRPAWLRRLPATWPVRLTQEDERRAEMYAAERASKALKASAVSMEDYLRGLGQRLVVERVRPETLPRAAQLHQRTNQFNLTTARLTEADISAMAEDRSGGLALLGRVTDTFGDHGIVIAATARIERDRASIVSFLMSCRVIGREVERAFLGELIGELSRHGVRHVTGAYLATAKNGMVRDFYKSAGFHELPAAEPGMLWGWTIGETRPPGSEFITIEWES